MQVIAGERPRTRDHAAGHVEDFDDNAAPLLRRGIKFQAIAREHNRHRRQGAALGRVLSLIVDAENHERRRRLRVPFVTYLRMPLNASSAT